MDVSVISGGGRIGTVGAVNNETNRSNGDNDAGRCNVDYGAIDTYPRRRGGKNWLNEELSLLLQLLLMMMMVMVMTIIMMVIVAMMTVMREIERWAGPKKGRSA